MENESLDIVCKYLYLSKDYIILSNISNVVEILVSTNWLWSLICNHKIEVPEKHETFSDAEVYSALSLGEEFELPWVFSKGEGKVYPLSRCTCRTLGIDVSFSQLLHYVSTTNAKNIWKDAYKKYCDHCVVLQGKEQNSIILDFQSNVLREALCRLYKCPLIKPGSDCEASHNFKQLNDSHSNILPALGILEFDCHFLVVMQSAKYSVHHCVSFSPAKLRNFEIGSLFLIYQLLDAVRDTHDKGLNLGNITTDYLFIDNSLYLSVLPCIDQSLLWPTKQSNLEEVSEKLDSQQKVNDLDSLNFISFESKNLDYLSALTSRTAKEIIKTHKNVSNADISGVSKSLLYLSQLWVCHAISNLDYILCLNYFAGRIFNSPHHHPILPWVIDFSSPIGNCRDLLKTKFRINKGDAQLDQTYQMAKTSNEPSRQVAHHVTEVFSEITYYVYKARVTPKEILTKYVRKEWVPEHYPGSINRLYEWSPDECIPEFYLDSSVFKSIHEDLCDLGIPSWSKNIEDFLEIHRAAFESSQVSLSLHCWIDLNFGYKLSGNASVKAKNVCLQLVDSHTDLRNGGVIQLFSIAHPPKFSPSSYLSRSPKYLLGIVPDTRQEKGSLTLRAGTSEEMEQEKTFPATKKFGKSRSFAADDKLYNLDNPVYAPPKYNPLIALNQLETFYNFLLKSGKKTSEFLFPLKGSLSEVKQLAHSRRVQDIQTVGCLIVEIFASSKFHIFSNQTSLEERYLHARRVILNDKGEISCTVKDVLNVIFQIKSGNFSENSLPQKFELMSSKGLPPPSPHQFLQPIMNVIPFPFYFPKLSAFITCIKEYETQIKNAEILLSKNSQKLEFIDKVAELRVKEAASELADLLPLLDFDGIKLIIYAIIELFESKHCSVSAAWFLTGPVSQALGPARAIEHLMMPVLQLFESDQITEKHAKLFHRSFLLQLIVWFGLKTFLEHFITPLIEGVGGCKDIKEDDIHLPHLRDVGMVIESENLESPLDDFSESISIDKTPRPEFGETFSGSEGQDSDTEEQGIFMFEESGKNELSVPDLSNFRSPALDEISYDEISLQEDSVAAAASLCESPASEDDFVTLNSTSENENSSFAVGDMVDTSIPLLTPPLMEPEFSSSLPSNWNDDNSVVSVASSCHPSLSFSDDREKNLVSTTWSKSEYTIGDICCESVLWLSQRLGPVLTSRYLTRNLLRMLALCYMPDSGALSPMPPDPDEKLSITKKKILGDKTGAKVVYCLMEIARLYGEQVILLQYLCHICELVASCRRKLSATLEGGLLGSFALLQVILTFLSDNTFMEQLEETFLANGLYQIICLVSSTKTTFPSGHLVRNILAWRIIDCLYIIAVRVGREMSKNILLPSIDQFLSIFNLGNDTEESCVDVSSESVRIMAGEEIKQILAPELAYFAYVPFSQFLGVQLPYQENVMPLVLQYLEHNSEMQAIDRYTPLQDAINADDNEKFKYSCRGTANAAVTGNRIDVKESEVNKLEAFGFNESIDLTKFANQANETKQRHLRGNWLAYWEHEIGRNQNNGQFNFKQIKLQTFSGHTNGIKGLVCLDNENSFMSSSKDKTVKLWSLRSHGDGSAHCGPQYTYMGHKKSVFGLAFSETLRLVASCDSTVHVWDPFLGACLKQLDSLKHSPVTVSIGGAGLIRCLATGKDNNLLTVAHSSGVISVLDIRTGQLLSSWKPHEREVLCVQWYKGGTFISSAVDQSLSVWSVDDKQFKFTLRGPTEPVHLINLYCDEIISGTTANRIGVHTAVSPMASFSSTRLRSDTFRGVLTAMTLLPLNRLLLLGSDNGNIRLLC